MPSTLIEDAPLTVRLAGQRWSPENYDGGYHGWTTARRVLENSFNTATARLALDVGLPEIVGVARRMGIQGNLDPVPSLSLGAFEASPLEVATVYATLANGGVRPPVHGLVTIFDADGNAVPGRALPPPEPVLSPETAYLVTSVLQGVIERGTGAAARRQVKDRLAGKTGTSNDRRDNWFAGYGPEEAAVVWVGYDDNGPTRMSGSRAGVPIWARYMESSRPAGGRGDFDRPAGVVTEEIDPLTGELATAYCPQVMDEVFLKGRTPSRYCHLHSGYSYGYGDDAYQERYGYGDDGYADDEQHPDDEYREGDDGRPRRHPFKRWLKKVFGDG
jgi:penicillin-binding protein 1B